MASIFHITPISVLDTHAIFDIALTKSYVSILGLLASGRAFYKKVADIDSENLEEIFYLTNSIDEPWTKQSRRVKSFFESCRSTSVGDIVEVHGKFFLVCAFGFKVCPFDFHLHAKAFAALDDLKKDGADFLERKLTPLQISAHLIRHINHPNVVVAETLEEHVEMWVLAQRFRSIESHK